MSNWAQERQAAIALVLGETLPAVQERLDRVDPVLSVHAATNRATIQGKASSALATNRTYLALATPTNAQVAAQVKALTRECSALIRLLLQQLDSADGT